MKAFRFFKAFVLFFPLFIVVHIIVDLVFGSTMEEIKASFTWKEIASRAFSALLFALIYSFLPKEDKKQKK